MKILEDCGGDFVKEKVMKIFEEEFVRECKKYLFEDVINYIVGVFFVYVFIKKYDYMSKYLSVDYMVSE